MLDFMGGLLLVAAIVVAIGSLTNALVLGPRAKLALLGILGLWIGAQASIAFAGGFGREMALDYPLIGVMVATPPLVVALAAVLSQQVRTALLALPIDLLVGLNILRVFGGFFLLLAWSGRLAGPFPISAGWGDVITGVVAIPIAAALMRGWWEGNTLWLWNAFGMIDLLLAVGLGTLSFNGFQFQLIEAGPGSDAVQYLPWSLIPTVLVPYYLVLHGVIFAQLRERAQQTPAAA